MFEHRLTEACLYKDVLTSASHIFAGGTQEWRERCHLPSKSACGPREDLRHRKYTTHLCLHRPQATVVQRSSGQNNEAVSTYHHTLKRVKRKKDSDWIQDCLGTQSLAVFSGPAMAIQYRPSPFFTCIRCREWLKLLLFSSRRGSALEGIWWSFKLFIELHQKITFCKCWSYHCSAVIQLKKALNTSDINKTDTAYHTLSKQLEHLCWESREIRWHWWHCHKLPPL